MIFILARVLHALKHVLSRMIGIIPPCLLQQILEKTLIYYGNVFKNTNKT